MGRTTGRSHALFMSLTEFCLEQSKVTDMKFADNASIDDNTHGGGEIPPRTGLTPDALPEVQEPVLAENSQTGVSTRNALSGTDNKPSGETKPALTIPRSKEEEPTAQLPLKPLGGNRKKFPIGMPSVSPTDAKRRHTIIWSESM